MQERICTKCEKRFQSSEDQREGLMCYDCALAWITKGLPPEEGDFNTASIISGTLTSDEKRWLMEDLRAAEGSSLRRDWYENDDAYHEEELKMDLNRYYEDLFPGPDEHCPKCGAPMEFCHCE